MLSKLHNRKTYITVTFFAMVSLFLFGVLAVFADWAPVTSTPTNTNEDIAHFITANEVGQVKSGRFGIVTAPPNQFDFRVGGHASFLGGLWTTGANFRDNVQVGLVTDRNMRVYSNNFQVFGTQANIQNDRLRHGNTAIPQPVCSIETGELRLCSCDTTASSTTEGAANCPS